jgi:hypothetical protein
MSVYSSAACRRATKCGSNTSPSSPKDGYVTNLHCCLSENLHLHQNSFPSGLHSRGVPLPKKLAGRARRQDFSQQERRVWHQAHLPVQPQDPRMWLRVPLKHGAKRPRCAGCLCSHDGAEARLMYNYGGGKKKIYIYIYQVPVPAD